jgi:hypothetical protein
MIGTMLRKAKEAVASRKILTSLECNAAASPGTTDAETNDDVNMIELDDNSENCAVNVSDTALELTPYPYTPTSEEMMDYYQLEESLGEDWSFRVACGLTASAVSMDEDDDDFDTGSMNDSVSFFEDAIPSNEKLSLSLPEDIEIRTYTRTSNFHDVAELSSETFSKYECF